MQRTLLPYNEREGKQCIFCGARQSVKYLVTVDDSTIAPEPFKAYCCNVCALVGRMRSKGKSFEKALAEYLASENCVLQRWIPIEERLPNEEEMENSPFYTFIVRSSGEIKEAAYNDAGGYFYKNGFRLFGVTHWMPMPEYFQNEDW